MSSNPFDAVQVPQPVRKELTARQDPGKLARWTAKRVPWMHMMSMAEGCPKTVSPLGNTTSTLTLFGNSASALYGTNTKLPRPVITSISVGLKGNLGSTREAKVELTAFTDEQLVDLQKCYFIPGMDVRVQFGWSESCTGDAPPQLYTVKEATRARGVCEITNKAKNNPNYDGFQGIVSNFNYGLQPDNTWKCSIEITSPADAFADTTIYDSECGCTRMVKTPEPPEQGGGTIIGDFLEGAADFFGLGGQDSKEPKEHARSNGLLYALFYDLFVNHSSCGQDYVNRLTADSTSGSPELHSFVFVETFKYYGKARTENGSEDTSWYEGTIFDTDGYDTTEAYISWGMLEAAINKYCIPNAEGMPYGRIDSAAIKLVKPAKAMSSDPRVCVLGGGYKDLVSAEAGTAYGPFQDAVTGTYVRLCAIRLNCIFLMMELQKVLDGDRRMSTFLNNVMAKVNQVCGNPWSIQIISNSENEIACDGSQQTMEGASLSVVDLTQYKGMQTYEIPAGPNGSVARSISLDMKLTGAMKTQAIYGSGNQPKGSGNTAKGGEGTGCEGKALQAFYVGQGITKNLAIPTAKKKFSKAEQAVIDAFGGEDSVMGQLAAKVASCDCDAVEADKKATEPTLDEACDTAYEYINDQNVATVEQALIKQIHKDVEEDNDHCNGVMLPFDFGCELDGIGGFRWGQVVSCDRIPAPLRKDLQWQIIKVDQEVTVNDWVTKLGTMCRPAGKKTI